MKKQIFYFTGTGNSLSIARKINSQLTDFSLHSIVKDMSLAIDDEEKQIIIVTPVYMYNIPYIVKEFIDKLTGKGSCSIVYSGGGELGKCQTLARKLFAAKSLDLISQYNIPMPSNYAPFGATEESAKFKFFSDAESRIDEICRMLIEQIPYDDQSNTSFFKRNLYPGVLYSMGYKYLHYMDKGFTADSRCDGCGICAKICPVDNIRMIENRPQWQNKCQQCYACFQWCPPEAIQYKNKTASVKRYRNPEINLKDIISSNTH